MIFKVAQHQRRPEPLGKAIDFFEHFGQEFRRLGRSLDLLGVDPFVFSASGLVARPSATIIFTTAASAVMSPAEMAPRRRASCPPS